MTSKMLWKAKGTTSIQSGIGYSVIAQGITLLVGCFILGFFLAGMRWILLWHPTVPQEKTLCPAQVVFLSNTSLNSSSHRLPRARLPRGAGMEGGSWLKTGIQRWSTASSRGHSKGGTVGCSATPRLLAKASESLGRCSDSPTAQIPAAAPLLPSLGEGILHSASLLPSVSAANSRKGWMKPHRCFNYDLITEQAEESILRNVQLEKILRTI